MFLTGQLKFFNPTRSFRRGFLRALTWIVAITVTSCQTTSSQMVTDDEKMPAIQLLSFGARSLLACTETSATCPTSYVELSQQQSAVDHRTRSATSSEKYIAMERSDQKPRAIVSFTPRTFAQPRNIAPSNLDLSSQLTERIYDPPWPPDNAQQTPVAAPPTPLELRNFGWEALITTEASCNGICSAVNVVEKGQTYYLQMSAVTDAVSALVSQRLKEQFEQSPVGQTLKMTLVPILTDGLSHPPPAISKSFYTMELTRKEERRPTTGLSSKYSNIHINMGTSQSIPFSVNLRAKRCVQITISVWDEQMTVALDGFVVTIPVVGATRGKSCQSDEILAMRPGPQVIGLSDEIDLYAPNSQGDSHTANVAIHVFEIGSQPPQSYAVVVTRATTGQVKVSGWQLRTTISASFKNASEFEKGVFNDRRNLGEADKGVWLYKQSARYLKKRLFTSMHRSDSPRYSPDKTFEEIKTLIESASGAQISAQFFLPGGSGGSQRMYLPLRLIAAPGSKLIGNNFAFVSPTTTRSNIVKKCVNKWNIIIDERIKSDLVIAKDAFRRLVAPSNSEWLGTPMTSVDQVYAFLNNPIDLKENPEGLIIIAHHDSAGGNSIAIEKNRESLTVEDFEPKLFPPGSVAFVASCGVSGPASSGGIISTLNNNNIDAFVASPLAVNTEYAVMFIDQMVKALDRAYSIGEELTLAQLYAQATDATTDAYRQSKGGIGASYQNFEYVLIGDPSIKICPRVHEESIEWNIQSILNIF